jgi:hypothetical protein
MPDGRTTLVMFPRAQQNAQTIIFSMQAAALLWPTYLERVQPGA